MGFKRDYIKEINEMGQYTFVNLKGHEDFSKKVTANNIIIVGKNFGCGSSRQQAVDCFVNLGISLIINESTGAIYKRNAINSGLAIMECDQSCNLMINHGDELEVNIRTGVIRNLTSEKKNKDTFYAMCRLQKKDEYGEYTYEWLKYVYQEFKNLLNWEEEN